MDTIYIIICIFALAVAAAAIFAFLSARNKIVFLKQGHEKEVTGHIESENRLRAELEKRDIQDKDMRERMAQMQGELMVAQSREKTLTEDRQRLDMEYEARFKRLAKEILDENSKSIGDQHQKRLDDLIKPFATDFERFRNEFTESYNRETRERNSLSGQLKQLYDISATIGSEARRLSDALKGNTKVQGDWGELILENILEQSGLEKNRDYYIQYSTTDGDGNRLRPDAVIKLPGRKFIVIDSKVSLSSYLEMQNTQDEASRSRHAAMHLQSVKKHIAELTRKNYQDYIGDEKLDFVMMFIPGEAPYSAALSLEPELWYKAFSQRVMLVSPTNLCVTLRLISQIWAQEHSTANALKITEEATKMLEKFTAFTEDLEKLDRAIMACRNTLDDAKNKLSQGKGNLIRRGENIKALGIKTKKEFPESMRLTDDTLSISEN